MSLSRRHRTLEKLNAVKARKRHQSTQAARQIAERSDDVSEVQVGDSKLDKNDDSIAPHVLAPDENGEAFPDNITDSPLSSRADDDEGQSRKVATDSPASSCSDDYQEAPEDLLMPSQDDGEPPIVDTREDSREVRRNKLYKYLSRDSSKGESDKSTDAQNASEVEIQSTDINKASPLRRFDIVEGSFGQQGVGRTGKGAHKKSSKAKLSEKHRRSRKMGRDHTTEDDTLSFDSQLEAWMSEGKGNPLASALDRVFDYFDEMRSVGDESYSIRTEKTEGTVPVASRRSAGSFFADVEGIFAEGFSCGSLVATCESLTAPTYSFHEDESTLSGTKGSKEALDSNASMDRIPKRFEGDSRSERSSVLPEDEDAYTSTIATHEESKLPNKTKALEQGQRVTDRKSFNAQYGALCRDMCLVPVDCLNETPEINGIGNASSPNKLQQLVQQATDQAAYIRNNLNSDIILDIGQHSDTSSALPAPETESQNILTAGESSPVTLEKNWSLSFLSGGSLLSHVTQTVSVETRSVAEGQECEPNTNERGESNVEDNGEDEGTDDRNYLYAVGQSIKPSASFFSLDTRTSHVKTKADAPKTAFQEAVAKLREIKSTPVPDRIRELGDHVKEVLTCTANVIPQDSSSLDLPTDGQSISISMENLHNICSCTECHAPATDIAVEENFVHHDVEQEANVVSLEDSATKLWTITMDMAKQWENTDQTRTGTDRPEWTLLQDWHENVPAERYSADSLAEIVSDDEHAEPENILSSTISTMGGISSAHAASTLGVLEEVSLEVPLETVVKPRRKWEPISKASTGNVVGHAKDVKERGNDVPVTSGHGFNDENAPNKKSMIPSGQWICEQSGSQKGGLQDTFHPFVSTKAKREAWRNTQAGDFVDIMSANAWADDWNQIVSKR